MMSVSAIAEVGNSATALFVTENVADTVKVRKTDEPLKLHSEAAAMDLQEPDNLKPDTAIYDEKSGLYKVGTKLGDKFLSQPWMMNKYYNTDTNSRWKNSKPKYDTKFLSKWNK